MNVGKVIGSGLLWGGIAGVLFGIILAITAFAGVLSAIPILGIIIGLLVMAIGLFLIPTAAILDLLVGVIAGKMSGEKDMSAGLVAGLVAGIVFNVVATIFQLIAQIIAGILGIGIGTAITAFGGADIAEALEIAAATGIMALVIQVFVFLIVGILITIPLIIGGIFLSMIGGLIGAAFNK